MVNLRQAGEGESRLLAPGPVKKPSPARTADDDPKKLLAYVMVGGEGRGGGGIWCRYPLPLFPFSSSPDPWRDPTNPPFFTYRPHPHPPVDHAERITILHLHPRIRSVPHAPRTWRPTLRPSVRLAPSIRSSWPTMATRRQNSFGLSDSGRRYVTL